MNLLEQGLVFRLVYFIKRGQFWVHRLIGASKVSIFSMMLKGFLGFLLLLVPTLCVAVSLMEEYNAQDIEALFESQKIERIVRRWVKEKYPKMQKTKVELLVQLLLRRIDKMMKKSWSPWKPGEDMFARILK